MKSILQLNNSLMESIVEEEELSNNRSFSQNILPTSTIDNDLTLNFIKDIILNNDIKEDSSLEMITDSVQKFQMKVKDNCLFNILNMRNNISFNKDNDNLDIDDNTKQKNYPLLSTLNVPFTSHTTLVLLYEIIKFVKRTSGYGGNYSWSVFLLDNSLTNNYFSRMNLSRYNQKYQRYIFTSLVLELKVIL